jgi:hypothetical protein
MYTPFVRILPCSLVSKQTFEQELAELRICIEEDRPGREDDVDCVDVLDATYISEGISHQVPCCTPRR